MRIILKQVLTFALAIVMCLGVTAIVRAAAPEYAVANAATGDGYYSDITAEKGEQLLGQLHDLITTTHTRYTTYDDLKTYGPITDPGLDGRGVLEFYTHETIMKFVGGVGDWNREHVWCQSLSNEMWGTGGGGADMHHLRPSESGLNSIRGNNKYGIVNGGKEAWSRDNNKNNSRLGGHVGGGTFEPLDNVKGDVARIVMYVYTHYNTYSNFRFATTNGKGSAKFGTLNFTNVITASNEAAAIQMLLEWNRLDPVDDIERYRNEKVYEVQKNRNPFIDNSSYADAIWGSGPVIDPGPGINPPPAVELTGFALDSSEIVLNFGETYGLRVIPTPANASVSANWFSDNDSVATVVNGVVTAKGAGTATITATSSANPAIKATATITVIKSSASKAVITLGSFKNPGGYGFYEWNADGIRGTAYIYGSGGCMQFNTSKTSYYIASTSAAPAPIKSVTVTAKQKSADWKLLTSDKPYSQLSGGNPENGNDRGTKGVTTDGATWAVSGQDTYFALIREGSGAAYLESIEIEFGDSPGTSGELENIMINPSAFTLHEEESRELSVLCVPSSAEADVEWTSDNEEVATVSPDGEVIALRTGTATITATCKTNPAIKATATVTVIASAGEDDPAVSGDNVATFKNAVNAIDGNGTLSARRAAVTAAVTAYNKLTAEEKTQVENEHSLLINEIDKLVEDYKDAAQNAERAAISGIL